MYSTYSRHCRLPYRASKGSCIDFSGLFIEKEVQHKMCKNADIVGGRRQETEDGVRTAPTRNHIDFWFPVSSHLLTTSQPRVDATPQHAWTSTHDRGMAASASPIPPTPTPQPPPTAFRDSISFPVSTRALSFTIFCDDRLILLRTRFLRVCVRRCVCGVCAHPRPEPK